MSEVQKPVEEPVPALAETAPVEASKVEETTAAPATTTQAPVTTEPATTTAEPTTAATTETAAAPVEAAKKEFDGTGMLGYKGPGGFIKKLAGFQRKYFYLQEEPIHHKSLSNYLRGEKPEIGNHNAAWSSQTGKGLLYFSKSASDKATPAGVINLSDISDIKEDGTLDFSFTSHGQKHVFQATSGPERTQWVNAIKASSEEAKTSAEGIRSSEGYKTEHSALSKPAVPAAVAAVAPKAVENKIEAKKEESAEKKEEKKEEKAEKKEEKKEEKSRKDRSASRKRNSIFGTFGFKKEEEKKAEAATTPAAAAPAAEPTTTETAPVAAVDGASEPAPAVVAPVAATETAKTETPEVAKEEPRPAAANKRNSSIFGTFKFGQKKDAKAEAPIVPAKDETATTATTSDAPVIPAVETTEPLAATVASPANLPVETTHITNGTTAAAAEPEVKAETKPETKATEKRKASLPFGLGAPKKETAADDAEKPKSPFAKLRQTIKSKSSPRAAAPAEKATETKAEEPAAATETTPAEVPVKEETPAISEPEPAAPAAAPQVSATA